MGEGEAGNGENVLYTFIKTNLFGCYLHDDLYVKISAGFLTQLASICITVLAFMNVVFIISVIKAVKKHPRHGPCTTSH